MSRSRDQSKKNKTSTKSSKRMNLLETPMVVKKVSNNLNCRQEKLYKLRYWESHISLTTTMTIGIVVHFDEMYNTVLTANPAQ